MVEKPRDFAKSGAIHSQNDVTVQAGTAGEARRRAAAAHLKAAQRHLEAARLHERAAAMYERARRWRRGDDNAHLRAMEDHRAAAKRRRQAADDEMRRAASEVDRVRH